MKNRYLIPMLTILATLPFAGCSLLGTNPAPPVKFEQATYEVVTNVVQKEVVVFKTNEIGQIVYATNVVQIPHYSFTPNQTTKELVATGGSIINAYAPGVGSAVGGIVLGLLAMWGKLRSTKNTGTALAQEIEAIREFVKTLPEGAKYDAVIVQFLKDHQLEQGALTQIVDLLGKSVSNPDAKAAVEEMKNALAMLK